MLLNSENHYVHHQRSDRAPLNPDDSNMPQGQLPPHSTLSHLLAGRLPGARAFLSRAPQILDGLAACARADAKPAAKLALATALLNFSAHFATGDDEAVAAQAASVGAELALCVMDGGDGAAKVDDTADAIFFRALVALGTMAAKSPETKATLRDLGVAELAEAVTSRKAFAGGKAVQAAEDVKKALA